jgi:hypothetical protein
MYLSAPVEALNQNNSSPKRANLFVVCILTLLCTFVLLPSALYGQNQEFPIYPKYQVMGVVYAPPGAASSVTYGSSTLVGSSHSMVENSTYDNVTTASQTTGFSLFGFGDSKTTTTSNSWGTANTNSTTYAMQTTSGNAVTTMGPVSSSLGVNHDNDIIYIWLNPVVIASVASTGASNAPPYGLNWGGMQFNSCDLTDASDQVNFLQLMNGCDPNQYPYPDIIGIPVWCLKNPYYPGQACAQWLPFTSRSWDATPWGTDSNGAPLGPGLNLQDYADILRADPFLTQTIAPDQYTVGYYCHPTYGVNLDPNDTEVIPDSTKFSTTVLASGVAWPARFCGTTGNTMSRFDPYGTVQYPAPGPNGEPQTYTGSFTYSTTTTTGQSATTTSSYSYNQNTTTSFSFSASFAPLLGVAGAVFAQNLSAGFNFSFSNGNGYSYSSAQTNTTADSTGTTNSAGYSITGPQASDNYTGPVTFNVYKDDVYGTFAFYSDEQRQQPPIELSAIAGQAPIGVSSTTTFGSVQVGSTSTTQTITLTNNSPYPMTMVGPAVTFTDPGFQIITGSDYCSNVQLQPNGTAPYTCTMTIEFAPVISDAPNEASDGGKYPVHAYLIAAGTANVSSWENYLVTSTNVVVSGTATPAQATCTNVTPYCDTGATLLPTTENTNLPYVYDFTTPSAYTPQTETFTFANYYSATVTFPANPADMVLSDTADFKVLNVTGSLDGCSGATVASGGTCTFTLQYLPGSAPPPSGVFNTKITAVGTVAESTGAIPLAFAGAVGTAAAPLSFSPTSLSFSFALNATTFEEDIPLTLTNHTAYTIDTLNAPTIWWPSAENPTYAIGAWMSPPIGSGTCPSVGNGWATNLGPGASCTTDSVWFADEVINLDGTWSGTLTFVGNLNNSALTPISVSIPFTATVTGSGDSTKITLAGAEQSETETTPATNAKGSVTITALKTPTAAGTISVEVGTFKAIASFAADANGETTADALVAALNAAGSPVKASRSGGVITLKSVDAGTAGNLALEATGDANFELVASGATLTGGKDATTTTKYDGGDVNVTTYGVTASAAWGKEGTPQSIAQELATSINKVAGAYWKASASGDVVTLKSVPNASGSSGSIGVGVVDSAGFTPPSFGATAN